MTKTWALLLRIRRERRPSLRMEPGEATRPDCRVITLRTREKEGIALGTAREPVLAYAPRERPKCPPSRPHEERANQGAPRRRSHDRPGRDPVAPPGASGHRRRRDGRERAGGDREGPPHLSGRRGHGHRHAALERHRGDPSA